MAWLLNREMTGIYEGQATRQAATSSSSFACAVPESINSAAISQPSAKLRTRPATNKAAPQFSARHPVWARAHRAHHATDDDRVGLTGPAFQIRQRAGLEREVFQIQFRRGEPAIV